LQDRCRAAILALTKWTDTRGSLWNRERQHHRNRRRRSSGCRTRPSLRKSSC